MKSKIALITLALVASAAASATNFGTGVVAGAAGSNSLVSGSASSVSASGTGSATSQAFNQGFAATSVKVGGAVDGKNTSNLAGSGSFLGFGGDYTKTTTAEKSGNVTIEGSTETANLSGVKTTQTGSAMAAGAAGGIAKANAVGAGAFDTGGGANPAGSVVGSANALTASGVAAVGNGTNYQDAGMLGSFKGAASADIKTTTVQTGTKAFGAFVPLSQPSSGDVKNAATSTNVVAGSTGGFGFAAPWGNSGSAVGGVINNASGSAIANSSVAGKVSAAHVGQ